MISLPAEFKEDIILVGDSIQRIAISFWYHSVTLFGITLKDFIFWSVLGTFTGLFLCGKRSQPILRHGLTTDIFYYFMLSMYYGPLETFLKLFFINSIYSATTVADILQYGSSPLRDIPGSIQVLLILLLYDIMRYWIHRFSHSVPFLWRFHVIHHSSRDVDWMSVQRFHPVNLLFQNSIPMALLFLAGFSPKALIMASFLDRIVGIFEHSNLDWTFGPLRKIIVNPVYHRWHHTLPDEGGNKNFAGWFPFLDVLFGTFYMPEEKIPMIFGIEGETMPENFIDQIIYPFKKKRIN